MCSSDLAQALIAHFRRPIIFLAEDDAHQIERTPQLAGELLGCLEAVGIEALERNGVALR